VIYHRVTAGRLTNRHDPTNLTHIELQQQVTAGRLTIHYRPSKVGISTNVICCHAFTAGRLTNRSHRYNRNIRCVGYHDYRYHPTCCHDHHICHHGFNFTCSSFARLRLLTQGPLSDGMSVRSSIGNPTSPTTEEHVPTGTIPPARSILMYTTGKWKPDSLKLRPKAPLAETNSLRTAHLHRRIPREDRGAGGDLLRRSAQAIAAKNFDEMLDASVA
jgi:hypothetical protein